MALQPRVESRTGPRGTIALGVGVIIVSAIAGWLWFLTLGAIQDQQQKQFRVAWSPDRGSQLQSGPVWFYFDSGRRQLVARGVVDDDRKRQLVPLLELSANATVQESERFTEAVDRLAYESNASASKIEWLVLLLGALSGWLGVQLRTVINFVGVVCVKDELVLVRWWPWYALRPISGAIFGLLAVLLVQVGLLEAGNASIDRVTWTLVLSMLSGFGAAEFGQRLRLLVKTLFGDSPRD